MSNRNQIRKMILREMADVLTDDALFTHNTPPDDSPTGDMSDDESIEEGGDCGCGCNGAPGGCNKGKSGTLKATVLFKRDLYEIIEDAIDVYDQYEDADQISDEMIAEIEHFNKALKALRH